MKLSKGVEFCRIENKTYIGWNRYYPRLLKLSEGAVLFLKNLEEIADREMAFVKIRPGENRR
ncbi:MAG: hypothetical protein KAW12_24630 [Candidatus Aminicenantes bacterium]|nr:hypothetical protein [Candidatus Aminicenantes bacterium]